MSDFMKYLGASNYHYPEGQIPLYVDPRRISFYKSSGDTEPLAWV